jgi:hypothetical protein
MPGGGSSPGAVLDEDALGAADPAMFAPGGGAN